MAKNLILKVSEKGARKTANALKSVGSAVKDVGVKAGIATAGIGVLSAKLAGDFQKSLLEVSTLTGDFSDVALKKMSRELRQVASDSGLALGSISKAKYDIVSAGFSNAAESAEVLRVSAQLAVGGVTSAAEAADLLTTSLNAMGLDFTNTQKVADELFTTVRLGKTTMGELSATLGQVLPFANAAGLSLSGVGAAMATLTASGISTAQSATALRSAIQSLQSPSDQSRTLMRDMGIEVKRFDDGSIDLINTIKQFKGLDPETMRKLIPRVEGILAIQTMAQNFTTLSSNVDQFATNSVGASTKAFTQMESAFNTQFAKLKNNVQSIMITIGDVVIEQIQPFVEDANEELSELGNIGFDHMAKVIGENFSVILEALNVTISLFIDSIQNRVTLAGMFIKKELASLLPDFISGSEDLQKEFDAMSENITKRNADNFDMVANQLAFTFDFIKGKAKESADNEIAEMERSNQAKMDLRTADNENLLENLEIKGEIESADAERERELLTVRGLAQKQYFDKVAEQVTQLKKLGVDSTKAEQHGTKLRMQFMSQEISAKTSQASEFLSLAKQATGNNKKFAGITRALAKGEATVKAFEAANKTFAKFGGWPAGIVPAGLALSIGMANVAAIDSQKFATGGIVQGIDTGQGDTVPAMLTPGELVLNQAQQQNVANALGGITINFTGPITNDDYVRDFIIPEIDKVVRSNLA
tara:strand:+ start:9608 stop:11722 length:2115 start_codon:yes stop_codon:yes gene_type:complete